MGAWFYNYLSDFFREKPTPHSQWLFTSCIKDKSHTTCHQAHVWLQFNNPLVRQKRVHWHCRVSQHTCGITTSPYKVPHFYKTHKKNLIKTLKKTGCPQWLSGLKHIVFNHDECGLGPLKTVQNVYLQSQVILLQTSLVGSRAGRCSDSRPGLLVLYSKGYFCSCQGVHGNIVE